MGHFKITAPPDGFKLKDQVLFHQLPNLLHLVLDLPGAGNPATESLWVNETHAVTIFYEAPPDRSRAMYWEKVPLGWIQTRGVSLEPTDCIEIPIRGGTPTTPNGKAFDYSLTT